MGTCLCLNIHQLQQDTLNRWPNTYIYKYHHTIIFMAQFLTVVVIFLIFGKLVVMVDGHVLVPKAALDTESEYDMEE